MRAIQTVVLEGNPKGTVQRNAKTQHCLLSLSEGTSASEAANLNLTDLHHADLSDLSPGRGIPNNDLTL